jgi:hypothetical protein
MTPYSLKKILISKTNSKLPPEKVKNSFKSNKKAAQTFYD